MEVQSVLYCYVQQQVVRYSEVSAIGSVYYKRFHCVNPQCMCDGYGTSFVVCEILKIFTCRPAKEAESESIQ